MYTLSRQVLVAVFVLFSCISVSFAQKATWEHNFDQEITTARLSKDGKYLIYITDDDNVLLECLNAETGVKLWTRPLTSESHYALYITRFIDSNTTILAPGKGAYEFIRPEDGSVLASMPIAGETWDDMKWEFLSIEEQSKNEKDSLAPFFRNNIGVFYFDEGLQIVDMVNRNIIYQTTEAPSSIKYYEWENKTLIKPLSGADTFYIVDFENRKLFYKASLDDHNLNSSIYQPYAVNENEILLFTEDNIESVDATTGTTNAIIDVDPDDPEFCTPVVLKKGQHLLVSDEGIQKMYRTKDGKMLWATAENQIPGIAEQYVEVTNDQGLLMTYIEDGKMSIYKVDNATGNVIWNKQLFTQDGGFEPGHKQGSKVWATIGAIAFFALQTALTSSMSRSGWVRDGSTGMYTHYYTDFYGDRMDQRNRQNILKNTNDMYNSWINTKKSTEGYTSVLSQTDDQVMLVTAGKIYAPTNTEEDDYDGEGVITLKLSDGSVIEHNPGQMIAGSEKNEFNAFKDLEQKKLPKANADALLGTHDIYVVKDGKVERQSFGEETTLTFISSNDSALTFRAFHDGDDEQRFDYWRYDATQTPTKRILMARSDVDIISFDDSSSTTVTVQVNAEEGYIAAHKLLTGDVRDADFAAPLWTISGKEMEELELNNFQTAGMKDSLQGIKLRNDRIYIMSEQGLSAITIDGKCQWVHNWEPERLETRFYPSIIGKGFVFSTGDDTRIIRNDCTGDIVGQHEISYGDVTVLHTDSGIVIVMDVDEGLLYGYNLK